VHKKNFKSAGAFLCRYSILAIVAVMAISGAVIAATTDWPSAVSKLNSWNGFKLVKGVRCPVCYSLVIPKNFGLKNEKELRILIELPRRKVDDSVAYDLDGPLFADSDVLDHFLHLALDHGYAPAGRIILNPDKYNMLIGVETSEGIEGTHVIPLIRGYSGLNALIDQGDYQRLARNICHWSAFEYDFRITNILISEVTRRNNPAFAGALSTACNQEKALMRKHGEKFVE